MELCISTGVYADANDVKKLLGEKYQKLSSSEIKEKKEFIDDLLENDISMTVRLQIIYSKLSIRSVRSAFEESVGSRLQKFGGSDNGELLQRLIFLNHISCFLNHINGKIHKVDQFQIFKRP